MCLETVLLKGLQFTNLTLKLVQYLNALSILALQLTFPIFSYNTSLTFRARKVRVTFSLESLIRLTHRSSFRNSLGVCDVRAGHFRLRAFSQVKGLTGNSGKSCSSPKDKLVCPRYWHRVSAQYKNILVC